MLSPRFRHFRDIRPGALGRSQPRGSPSWFRFSDHLSLCPAASHAACAHLLSGDGADTSAPAGFRRGPPITCAPPWLPSCRAAIDPLVTGLLTTPLPSKEPWSTRFGRPPRLSDSSLPSVVNGGLGTASGSSGARLLFLKRPSWPRHRPRYFSCLLRRPLRMAARMCYGDLRGFSQTCAPPGGVCRVRAGGVLLVLGLQGVSGPERGQVFARLCRPTVGPPVLFGCGSWVTVHDCTTRCLFPSVIRDDASTRSERGLRWDFRVRADLGLLLCDV